MYKTITQKLAYQIYMPNDIVNAKFLQLYWDKPISLQYPFSYINLLPCLVYSKCTMVTTLSFMNVCIASLKSSIPVNVHFPSLHSASTNLFYDCIYYLNLNLSLYKYIFISYSTFHMEGSISFIVFCTFFLSLFIILSRFISVTVHIKYYYLSVNKYYIERCTIFYYRMISVIYNTFHRHEWIKK